MARKVLSPQPKAINLLSGDQLAPKTVSKVTGTESVSFQLSVSHTWTSPIRAGNPPVTASFVPSGENLTDSIRSDNPTNRSAMVELSSSWISTS